MVQNQKDNNVMAEMVCVNVGPLDNDVMIKNLCAQGLSEIPSEIFQLTSLTCLYLGDNCISEFPSKLDQNIVDEDCKDDDDNSISQRHNP